jgi:acyl carrier protein
MTDIEKKLIALAAKRFDKDASTLTAGDDFFEKLGIDSYQAMDMLTELEEQFDVEIPDYEVQGVSTFGGLAELIGRRL